MSSNNEIGELSQTSNCIKVEWKIENIFSYSEANKSYESQSFPFLDSDWYLQIYPCGENNDSVEWISIYLWMEGTKNKSVTYSFGLKKVDGTVEKIGRDHVNAKFGSEYFGWGNNRFLKTSKLKEERSQLAPSDTLTVICIMKLHNDDFEFTSRFVKLSENLEDLFISQKGSDATCKVKGKDFPVHRSILMARSPVLGAMFEVDMEEKNTGIVNIVDYDSGVFHDFLTYIYSGKFTISSSDVYQLYRIAHKYDVGELMSECVAYMQNNLTIDTWFDTAELLHQFHDSELSEDSELVGEIQGFFIENFEDIASTLKWKSFLREHLDLAYELLKKMAKNKSH